MLLELSMIRNFALSAPSEKSSLASFKISPLFFAGQDSLARLLGEARSVDKLVCWPFPIPS